MVDRLVAVDDADYRLPAPVLQALGADMGNPASALGAQLSATIDAVGSALFASLDPVTGEVLDGNGEPVVGAALIPLLAHRSGTDRIAALRDFGTGSMVVAAVGDSTWNDGDEAVRLVCREFGLTLPAAIRRTYATWNDATQSLNTPVVDNAGEGSGGSGGVEVSDDFNRVVADLVGTTAPSGATWAGSSGRWAADGSAAVPSGAGGLSMQPSVKDCTATVTINVITKSTTAGNFRVYLGGNIATLGANGIWVQLGVSASGVPSLSLWKTVEGTNTQIGSTNFSTGLTSNTPTVQTAVLELEIAIQNVTATLTVTGETSAVINGSITETDYSTLGPHAGVFVNTGGAPLYTVDSILIESPVAPSTADEFAFINGATAGKTLAYFTTRVDEMFPAVTPIDVLFVTDGHNHGAASSATFLTGVTDFLTAFAVNHPDAAIVFVSQNPEFAPAGNVAAHANRQRALRDWAQANGHEYLPVFEAFAAQPDGGASLVKADGIHPTTPPAPYTAWSGSRLTADKMLDAINARST